MKTTIKSEHMKLRQATHAVFTVGVACLFFVWRKVEDDNEFTICNNNEWGSALCKRSI